MLLHIRVPALVNEDSFMWTVGNGMLFTHVSAAKQYDLVLYQLTGSDALWLGSRDLRGMRVMGILWEHGTQMSVGRVKIFVNYGGSGQESRIPEVSFCLFLKTAFVLNKSCFIVLSYCSLCMLLVCVMFTRFYIF